MMEFNTDRMFWTIAALILGATLLTLANKAFPGIMDSIMGTISKNISTANTSAGQAADAASNAVNSASNYSFKSGAILGGLF